jgi:hypothetical protein
MKATRILIVCTFLFLPGILIAAEHTTVRFDGTWHTHVDCPARGNMEAFAWKFDSVIINGELRGVRGTEGEPGSFVLTGKINEDGCAKLSGDGILLSRKNARGLLAHKGEEYNWDVRAQFKDTDGTGARNEGLDIIGRACSFEFKKQLDVPATPAAPAAPTAPAGL